MKKTLITIGLCCSFLVVGAQDFHYSMFTMSPLTLNPALTGNFVGDIRVVNNYRMQWSTVSKAYTTYSLGADMPLARKDKKKGSPDFFAAGVNVNVDKAGSTALRNNYYGGTFSYNKSLDGFGGTYFSFGANLGFCQRSISLAGASWGAQWNGIAYDGALATGEGAGIGDSYNFMDMGVGLAVTSTGNQRFRLSGGLAANHITRPRVDFLGQEDRLHMKISVHGKAEIALGESSNAWLVPSVLYVQQGPARLINVGVGAKYQFSERSRYTDYQNEKSFTVGTMYRMADAFSAYFRLDIASVGVAFNYDLNTSKLTAASNGVGAFEFMLIYTGLYSHVNTRSSSRNFF